MKIKEKDAVKDTPARQRGAIAQRPSQLFAQKSTISKNNYQTIATQQSAGPRQILTDNDVMDKKLYTLSGTAGAENPPLTDRSEQLTLAFEAIDQSGRSLAQHSKQIELGISQQSSQQTTMQQIQTTTNKSKPQITKFTNPEVTKRKTEKLDKSKKFELFSYFSPRGGRTKGTSKVANKDDKVNYNTNPQQEKEKKESLDAKKSELNRQYASLFGMQKSPQVVDSTEQTAIKTGALPSSSSQQKDPFTLRLSSKKVSSNKPEAHTNLQLNTQRTEEPETPILQFTEIEEGSNENSENGKANYNANLRLKNDGSGHPNRLLSTVPKSLSFVTPSHQHRPTMILQGFTTKGRRETQKKVDNSPPFKKALRQSQQPKKRVEISVKVEKVKEGEQDATPSGSMHLKGSLVERGSAHIYDAQTPVRKQKPFVSRQTSQNDLSEFIDGFEKQQQIKNTFSNSRNPEQTIDGSKTSDRKPIKFNKSKQAMMDAVQSQQNLHKPNSDVANALNFFSSVVGQVDEEMDSHEAIQIQQLKGSIVNSEFGIVSSSKQTGIQDRVGGSEKQNKEALRTKASKGGQINSYYGHQNQTNLTSAYRLVEQRKLKQKYLTQTLTNGTSKISIEQTQIHEDFSGKQGYHTNHVASKQQKKNANNQNTISGSMKKDQLTDSTATDTKQKSSGLITSTKAKNYAVLKLSHELLNNKNGEFNKTLAPEKTSAQKSGSRKQGDTPLQFYYSESKNMKKQKQTPNGPKVSNQTVNLVGTKEAQLKPKVETVNRCIMEVKVTKPWQAGIGSSLVYQQERHGSFRKGKRRSTGSFSQGKSLSKTFELTRGSLPSKNLPPLVMNEINQKVAQKYASELPSPEQPKTNSEERNQLDRQKTNEEADIFIKQESLVLAPQHTSDMIDSSLKSSNFDLQMTNSKQRSGGSNTYGYQYKQQSRTNSTKDKEYVKVASPISPRNHKQQVNIQQHLDVSLKLSKDINHNLIQTQQGRYRPLSAQSNSLMQRKGVPYLKTGAATSLMNAGKRQNIVTQFNSSLAVCSSNEQTYNQKAYKTPNVKQVDLIAAMDNDQASFEQNYSSVQENQSRQKNQNLIVNQSATSDLNRSNKNHNYRCSPFETYKENIANRKKTVMSQSPTKEFDAHQNWKQKKQATDNSSLNVGIYKESGKTSILSHAPRIKSMTEKNQNGANSSIQSRQVRSSLLLPKNNGQQSPIDDSVYSSELFEFHNAQITDQLETQEYQTQIPIKKYVEQVIKEPPLCTSQRNDVYGITPGEQSPLGLGLKMEYLGATRNNNQSMNRSSFQRKQARDRDARDRECSDNKTFNSSSSNDFSNMDEKLAVGQETQKTQANDDTRGQPMSNRQGQLSLGGTGINGVKETSQFLKANKLYSKNNRVATKDYALYNQRGAPKHGEGKYNLKLTLKDDKSLIPGYKKLTKTERTDTSQDLQDWEQVDPQSPEINEDELNTPSHRASLANFEENLKGDQIELKYFLKFKDQFNSFKVLKKPQTNFKGNVDSTAEKLQYKPYMSNYLKQQSNQHKVVQQSRNSNLFGGNKMSNNASKRLSKSQMSQTKSPQPQAQRMKKEYISKFLNLGLFNDKDKQQMRTVGSPTAYENPTHGRDLVEQQKPNAKRQLVPSLNLAPILNQQQQQQDGGQHDHHSTQAKFDSSRSDPLHLQAVKNDDNLRIGRAQLPNMPNTNRNSQSNQTLDKIRQRRKRVNTIFICQQEVQELRKRSQRDLNTDRGTNQNRSNDLNPTTSIGLDVQLKNEKSMKFDKVSKILEKQESVMPQIQKITTMDEHANQNAAQSPRFNKNRENKFNSDTQPREQALVQSQNFLQSVQDKQAGINAFNAKSKKRVQFILEETQEYDESNTAALSEVNPSQSIDDFNRLDTYGSSVQDQNTPNGLNSGTNMTRSRHLVSNLQKQRQAQRAQKKALQEFERKALADRKNAQEIAYQFIYNQNKELIQKQMEDEDDNEEGLVTPAGEDMVVIGSEVDPLKMAK